MIKMHLQSFIKKWWPIGILLLLTGIVCITNYTSGTWLTGWDNLHPEMNWSANIKRAFFSMWQEYQGLGLLAGMAHASDLFRTLFLYGISFIIPDHLIRYFYHFSMIIMGTIGIYFLLKDFILDTIDEEYKSMGALIGSFFYLLNLGTVQYFFFLFEPFSTFWGFFPWELYVLLRFFDKPSKKNLILLAVINFLAVPQAYVQTVFLVYVIVLAVFSLYHIYTRKTFAAIRNTFVAGIVILCINAFWILPNGYFFATDVGVTQNAVSNKVNSDRFFEMNKRRGTLDDFSRLQGFPFDTFVTDEDQQSTFAMQAWHDYYKNPIISLIGYIFFFIILFGLIQKSKYRTPLIILMLLSMLIFLSDTPVISTLNNIFRSLPLINQIFRNPFTKIIVVTVFVFSSGVAIGSAYLMRFLEKRYSLHNLLIGGFACFLILVQGYPAFQGEYIFKKLRVEIPQNYFQLFDFFAETDKNTRIMNLPQTSYWGWGSYSWGPIGSGFLWYGIEQPIMDRAFDVWSDELEQYYWELNYALQKRDADLFNDVLDKYHISYIIFDESYIPSESPNIRNLIKQEDFLKENQKIQLLRKYGDIRIYKVHLKDITQSFVLNYSKLPSGALNERFYTQDPLYINHGAYKETTAGNTDIFYPFTSLFTNRFQDERGFLINKINENATFSSSLPSGSYILSTPDIQKSPVIPVRVLAKKESNGLEIRLQYIQPELKINDKSLDSPNTYLDFEFPILNQQDFILDIDGDFINVVNVGTEYKEYGKSYLYNDGLPKDISLYNAETKKDISLQLSQFRKAQSCLDGKENNKISSHIAENTLTVSTTEVPTCLPYPDLLDDFESTDLLRLNIDFEASQDEYPKYCLFSDTLKRCLNQKLGKTSTVGKYQDYIVLDDTPKDSFSFSIILEPGLGEDAPNKKTISYSNMTLQSFEKLGDTTVTIQLPTEENIATYTVDIPVNSTISVTIPITDSSKSYSNLLNNGSFNLGNTSKERLFGGDAGIQVLDQQEKTLQFYSRNSTLNYWTNLPDYPPGVAHLLFLEAEHIEGFPLILDINTTLDKRKYVYALTTSSSQFVLQPLYPFDKGIQLMLLNSSFNSSPTVNRLSQLSVYPFSADYISDIRLIKGLTAVMPGKNHNIYAEKITNTKYAANIIKGTPESTLVLSQSFDKGWNAYEINCNPLSSGCKMATLFPSLFGRALPGHTTINGWANGWDMEAVSQDRYIIIVYAPQYLEYIGISLLPMTFIGIFFLSSRYLPKMKSE